MPHNQNTNADQDIREYSVAGLFKENQYVIPIYQRNYAWGQAEIEQLLSDVLDAATGGRPDAHYYIGTLVVFRRGAETFETVDGQQRHTTLAILLSVLKNAFLQSLDGINVINLHFSKRKKSEETLQRLFAEARPLRGELKDVAIRAAYETTRRWLSGLEEADLKTFTDYLLGKVRLLRVELPEDTDLNQYFEIMNNRGEQLEMHEVLKARLMEKLAPEQHPVFARIWEACSDMSRYAQLGFASANRDEIFLSDWNTCPSDFDALCQTLRGTHKDLPSLTLRNIIDKPDNSTPVQETEGEPAPSKKTKGETQPGTFSSVISFPNFLLHVLRVTTGADVPLDDKRLLDAFKDYDPEPSQFAIDLLRCRMLFDRYIIKRENEEDWSIQTIKNYGDSSFNYVISVKDPENKGLNQQLIMLQSMFHVSFPAMSYKHWLSAALQYLYKATMQSDSEVSIPGFINELEALSDRFLYGRFGAGMEPVDYYILCTEPERELPHKLKYEWLHKGTSVQNFIFNRLDYLLWKKLRGKEFSDLSDKDTFGSANMSYVLERVKKFRFTMRSSVEHYYPQTPPVGAPKMEETVDQPYGGDRFGNLCLISSSSNSRLNNQLPEAKQGYYLTTSSVESLKQAFMMSYPKWGPEAPEYIDKHERFMIEVLETRTS